MYPIGQSGSHCQMVSSSAVFVYPCNECICSVFVFHYDHVVEFEEEERKEIPSPFQWKFSLATVNLETLGKTFVRD